MSASTTSSPVVDRGALVTSFDLADHPIPTGREEAWRFTPLRRLRGLHDGTAVHSTGGLSGEVSAAAGVDVARVDPGDARLSIAAAPDDRVEAQTLASASEALLVEIPPEWVGTEPTVITLQGSPSGSTDFSRIVVKVGRFAEAVVVIDQVGDGTFGTSVELIVGDGARVSFVSIQDWDDTAVQVGRQRFRVGRDAKVRAFNATWGGDVVRMYSSVTYDGPGGDAELLGIFFADSGQHLEHRLFIDHQATNCRSNVMYKGALQGDKARSVWVGDVLIRAEAHGTDTYEINRNLILTDGARADSVPNLEIETGEIVGAGHASATGRFDDEQLFYLQSRGINEDDARQLVVRGFFADVIGRLNLPELQERLKAAIERELDQAGRSAR